MLKSDKTLWASKLYRNLRGIEIIVHQYLYWLFFYWSHLTRLQIPQDIHSVLNQFTFLKPKHSKIFSSVIFTRSYENFPLLSLLTTEETINSKISSTMIFTWSYKNSPFEKKLFFFFTWYQSPEQPNIHWIFNLKEKLHNTLEN